MSPPTTWAGSSDGGVAWLRPSARWSGRPVPMRASRPASTSSTDSQTAAVPTLEVGKVLRPHGLRGEVIVRLMTDRTERLATGAVLSSSAGDLEVVRATPSRDRWILSFAGVGD